MCPLLISNNSSLTIYRYKHNQFESGDVNQVLRGKDKYVVLNYEL